MTRPLSRRRLEAMVEEAIVDAYGESEQAVGLFTMIEDNLQLPFETTLLGTAVTVERVDLNDRDDIVLICSAARSNMLRVIDDSGEDYVYPSSCFLSVPLPAPVRQALAGKPR